MAKVSEEKRRIRIGVIITDGCRNVLTEDDANQLASRVYFTDKVDNGDILIQPSGKGGQGPAYIEEIVAKRGFTHLILGGYSPTFHEQQIEEIRKRTGLSSGAVRPAPFIKYTDPEKTIDAASHSILKAVEAVTLTPAFELQAYPLDQHVLVVGGGIAGVQAAVSLNSFGYSVTLVEQAASLGGDLLSWKAASGSLVQEIPENLTVLTKSRLEKLDGRIGSFSAVIGTPEGEKTVRCGAVVYTGGMKPVPRFPEEMMKILASPAAEPVEKLVERTNGLGFKKQVRNIGILLDLFIDETKASTEMALTIGRAVQKQDQFQVYIFCRDVRVGALELEKLYDDVREAGVAVVKYESVGLSAAGSLIDVTVTDAVLQQEITVPCTLLGISKYGVDVSADEAAAEITGILPDRLGRLQENNVHLLDVETNRPGIFVAGAVRGTYYIPQIIEEAKAAAMAVHTLLGKKDLEVELSQAEVDPDKCVLCLTCIRCCPYKAMHIDLEAGAAASYPEVCQKCGICAGECPAKAITLPAWSDPIVLSQV